jgi:site-specific DNA recombinase
VRLCKPLIPRHAELGLGVIIIGRVSTVQQDLENIEASFRSLEEIVAANYSGTPRIERLGERASGMLSTRTTIRRAEALIATKEWDVVMAEDMSRIFRSPISIMKFVFMAIRCGVRVITKTDGVDSADSAWLTMFHCNVMRHGLMVEDTRKRVQRTATHNFQRGGMVLKIPFGYRKLSKEEAAGQPGPLKLRIARCDKLEPVIREMCDRVLRGESYGVIADWLNDSGRSPRPYATSGQWSAATVKALLRKPLLHGERTLREVVHIPSYEGEPSRIERDPTKTERSEHPELAFLTREEHERVFAVMDARARGWKGYIGGQNPSIGRPRSRSPWPGQFARCSACGGPMYRMGNSSGAETRSSRVTPAGTRSRCPSHA